MNDCLPFWKFLAADDTQILKNLTKVEQVFTDHGHKLKEPLPLSSEEVISVLGKKPGPLFGKTLDHLRRKFLNGELQEKASMLVYLNEIQERLKELAQ